MKKIISMSVVWAMVLSCMTSVTFAETEKVVNFDDVTVGSNGQAVLPEGAHTWQVEADDKFMAVADGILGKLPGDKSVKMNDYYKAFKQSSVNVYMERDADLTQDFYVSTQVYVPEIAPNSLVRIGGEFYDGDTRVTAPCMFLGREGGTATGNAKIFTSAKLSGEYRGWYTPENWYTVVFSYNSSDNTMSWYADGEFMGSREIVTSITNLQLGARFDNVSASNLTEPNWVIIDDYKIVNSTYNPQDSDGAIASSNAAIKVDRKNPITRYTSNKERYNLLGAKITITDGTKVSDVEAALTATYGTDVFVADFGEIIDPTDWSLSGDNANALKTIIPSPDSYITSSMKAVSVAQDGSLTHYTFTIKEKDETLLSLASGSSYKLEGNEISGVKDATSVAEFKANFVASGELKFYSPAGYELKDATLLETGSKLRAYSASGNFYEEYNITVDGGSSAALDIVDFTSAISSKVDGTVLSKYEKTTQIDGAKILAGFSEKTGGGVGTHTYTKVTTADGKPAYKFESDYVFVRSTPPLYWGKTYGDTNTKKLQVTEFTIQPETNGRYFMYHKGNFSTGIGSVGGVQQYAASLALIDGKIKIGGNYGTNDNIFDIGTYENGKPYKIQYVIKEPGDADKAIYMQGIYVNDTKIFPKGDGTDPKWRNAFYDANTGYYVFANKTGLSSTTTPSMIDTPEKVEEYVTTTISNMTGVYFGVAATSADANAVAYYSNMRIYGTDTFPVVEQETVVDLDLTSDSYEVIEDAVLEGKDVVKGYSGTVANVLSNLDSAVTSTVAMLNAEKTAEVNPNATAKTGMVVRVSDLSGKNTKDYVLSDAFDAGVGESNYDADNKVFYASRTVNKYSNKEETLIYVAAVYDKEGRLLNTDTDIKTVSAVAELTFSVDLPCMVELKDGAVVKTMLWNLDTLTPYISAYIYDEVNGGAYDGETPKTNR